MNSFIGTIDELLEKCSKLNENELNQIEVDVEKSASISFIMKEMFCDENEAKDLYNYLNQLQIKEAIQNLLEIGEIENAGFDEDGNILYKLKNKNE